MTSCVHCAKCDFFSLLFLEDTKSFGSRPRGRGGVVGYIYLCLSQLVSFASPFMLIISIHHKNSSIASIHCTHQKVSFTLWVMPYLFKKSPMFLYEKMMGLGQKTYFPKTKQNFGQGQYVALPTRTKGKIAYCFLAFSPETSGSFSIGVGILFNLAKKLWEGGWRKRFPSGCNSIGMSVKVIGLGS